ncbi:MAG: hypothetical protein GXY55_03590 [Phycisphaerae bacterium]|nr:hypothetical protein [Phycisphaerae bacterium]
MRALVASSSSVGRPGRKKIRLLLWAAAAVVAFVGWRSMVMVEPGEVAVVHGLGLPGAALVAEPGLHSKAPWQAVRRVDGRLRLLTFEPVERLTADHEPLVIEPFACWRVTPQGWGTYLQAVTDAGSAERRLREIVWHVLDGELAGHGLREWLNSTGDAAAIPPSVDVLLDRVRRAAAAEARARLGIDLVEVGVRRLVRPERMKESMLALMLADREHAADRVRQETRVQVARIEALARREAELLLVEAQHQAAAIRLRGESEADGILAEVRKLNPRLTDEALRIHTPDDRPRPVP